MTAALITSLVVSLLLTLLFEAGFFFLVGKRDKRDFVLLLLVNVVTNPLVVLSFWLFQATTGCSGYYVIVPLELFAVLAEGLFYKNYAASIKRPFLFSLTANAFSFTLGFVLQLLCNSA